MGITVISAPAASAASTAGLGALSTAPDGLAGGFAALLTGLSQTADSLTSLPSMLDTKAEISKKSKRISDLLSAQDPAQLAQNLIPNIPPALENRLPIAVDRNNLPAANLKPEITPVAGDKTDKNAAKVSDLLGKLSNSEAGMGKMSDENADKNSNVIRDLLSSQEPGTNIIPNIAPGLENRPQIEVDRNKPQLSKLLGKSGTDATKPELLNPSLNAKNIESEASLTAASAPVFNSPTKSDVNLGPSTQPALSAMPQTSSNIAAILAGETNTGNTTPSSFATLMAGHASQAQQTQQPTPSNTPSVATPIQDNRWAQDFGDRIVWAAKNDQQIAQINITPAQLGPIQITLNMNGDQASIAFASPHAEVRKAIEEAMPNLREMLSTSGISLGQSNVGAQLQQQQRDTSPLFANGNRSTGETAILPADSRSGTMSTGLPIQRGRGLVDLFA